jgi:hypothetical protein
MGFQTKDMKKNYMLIPHQRKERRLSKKTEKILVDKQEQ